jgi:hypothetical protein
MLRGLLRGLLMLLRLRLRGMLRGLRGMLCGLPPLSGKKQSFAECFVGRQKKRRAGHDRNNNANSPRTDGA